MRILLFILLLLPHIHCYATNGAVVIQYHHVSNDTPPSTSISPHLFRQQLAYLKQNDFNVVPLTELVSQLKQGKTLANKTVAISFDDGYLSIFETAFPLLKQFQLPFTVFINTDSVGSAPFMNWQQLKLMSENGATIASHTSSHTHLIRRLPRETDKQWRDRIRDSFIDADKIISKNLGRSEKIVAYPYGEYNNAVKQIARQLKLTAFAQHSGAFDRQVDWQAIPRFAFGGIYTQMESFIEKVNSLPMPLTSARVTDENGNAIEDTVLPTNISRPRLTLNFDSSSLAKRVRCFASGQGRIETTTNNNQVIAIPDTDLPVGRSRYNCTASSDQPGRYYWYSQFFIRKNPDGSWYSEP